MCVYSIIYTITLQILTAFHVDRLGAAVSFMGKGIVAHTASSLCHLLKYLIKTSDDYVSQIYNIFEID